jgi:aminoglycoside 2'-N-acetyltransferase I
MPPAEPVGVRILPTDALSGAEASEIRALLDAAFGSDPEERFTDDDWEHAIGGVHVVADVGARVVAHASVVERELHVAGLPLRTGYVEAVAVEPARQGQGIGTLVIGHVNRIVVDRGFAIGALGTGSQHFYERLGWETWRGPSSVRTADGEQPTPDDDGYIMVLRTPASPPLELDAPISCDWRIGDAW